MEEIEKVEQLIMKAMKKVKSTYDSCERKWVKGTVLSCVFGDNSQSMEIYAREGSPMKGYIIVNYPRGIIKCFDAWDKQLYTWEFKSHSHINPKQINIDLDWEIKNKKEEIN